MSMSGGSLRSTLMKRSKSRLMRAGSTSGILDALIQDKAQVAVEQICEGVAQTHGAAVSAAASLVECAQVRTDIPPAME
jgi:hypothetical protein